MLPLQVKRTYSQGTYRAGAMRQVSLVGAVDEEVGDYFPEFISMLQESPFLEVSGSHSSACVRLCVHINTVAAGHGVKDLPLFEWRCNVKRAALCYHRGLCPGGPSPVCGCRAPPTATTAPSCGSDPESR